MALGSRFGEQVCRIAALGQQLWRTALGHNFGEQRRGTALGSSFGEQLGQLFGPALRQLQVLINIGILGSVFGTRLSVATLKSSFGEQLWGATLRL